MTEKRIGLAAFYDAVNASRGFSAAPHHYPFIAALEDESIDNLLYLAPPGTGKSVLLDSIYAAWMLGHDPSLTILAVSAGEKLPQGFMAATMQLIQHDKTFREIFPEVRPAPDLGWSIQRGLFVTGHHISDSDASYVSVGLTSKALTGLHARLHIYDDIHDRENSSTPESRAGVVQTYYDTLLGRADPRGCRRVAAGRWWAEDDVYQEWIKNGDWVVMELPASRPGNKRLWYDVYVPKGVQCKFTQTLEPAAEQDQDATYTKYRAYYAAIDGTGKGFYWPSSPVKRKEYETVRRRQPRTAAVNYDGDMSGGRGSVFREQDFIPYMLPADLSAGMGRATPGLEEWIKEHNGEIEQAWDTALGQPQSASLTVALTGMLVPCKSWHCGEDENIVGECDFHFDVWLLDALIKDLDFRELTMALRTQYALWHPRQVLVEEKQSGVSLLQAFRGSHIPVKGQKVEQGKVERAVNPVLKDEAGLPVPGGAASVQGWARMGRIRYPIHAPWIDHGPDGTTDTGFLKKVMAFHGGVRASDEFDALVHLVIRAIVRSRKYGRIAVQKPEEDIPAGMDGDIRRQVLESIGTMPQTAAAIGTPFQGFCGSPCTHHSINNNMEWCNFHGRKTMALDGCTQWKAVAA